MKNSFLKFKNKEFFKNLHEISILFTIFCTIFFRHEFKYDLCHQKGPNPLYLVWIDEKLWFPGYHKVSWQRYWSSYMNWWKVMSSYMNSWKKHVISGPPRRVCVLSKDSYMWCHVWIHIHIYEFVMNSHMKQILWIHVWIHIQVNMWINMWMHNIWIYVWINIWINIKMAIVVLQIWPSSCSRTKQWHRLLLWQCLC